MERRLVGLAVVLVMVGLPGRPVWGAGDERLDADGFQSLFDGRTLEGWETPDPSYWSVRDGAIVATITREHPCTKNQYLVWRGGQLSDFELKLESRVRGEGGINNGFQFRSRLLPDHDVCGYQVDNNLQTPWLVRLYDEYGRHTLAMRGHHTELDASGVATTRPLADGEEDAWFRLEDWHEYHLICRGESIELRVDGRLAASVVDRDPLRAEPAGVLALQLHSGPPTVAEFRAIRIKQLRPPLPMSAPVPPIAEHLQPLVADAAAWWPMEVGGHGATVPLRHVPQWERFELNVLAGGRGARTGSRAVALDGAYFEAPADLIPADGPFTVMVRARVDKSDGDATLLSQLGQGGAIRLRLLSKSAGDQAGAMRWEVRGESGVAGAVAMLQPDEALAWHDWVASFDGARLVLARNGHIVARANLEPSGALVPAAGPLIVAGEVMGERVERSLRGQIETVAIWRRALSEAEIGRLSRANNE